MKFPTLKPWLVYTKSQRAGIFALLLFILILQLVYYVADFSVSENDPPEKQKWLALQAEIDSLKQEKRNYKPQIYPFNPNFITDFKGYKLGMSVAEIDRLLAFRKTNRYVNSAAEFQAVTQISDSLLAVLSPYFKFPDWVTHKNNKKFAGKPFVKERITVLDINTASAEDLMKIYGIGPGLSERILKQKEALGGFVSMDQMADVWGLSPEVIQKLNLHFKIGTMLNVRKIRINEASVKELSQFPYFRYALAKAIVTHRTMNGTITNADGLTKIKDFPVDKVNIIALYLEF